MLGLKETTKKFILQHPTLCQAIDKSKMLIGSGDACDIKINDDTVSAIHAIIYLDNDGITVQDLRSQNGTYVNGVKVENQKIKEESTLSFGNFELEIIVDGKIKHIENVDAEVAVSEKAQSMEFVEPELTEDFKFEESNQLFVDLPILKSNAELDYVDIDDNSEEEDPRLDQASDELCLQMTILSNGHVFEIEHFRLDKGSVALNKGRGSIQTDLIPTSIANFVTCNGSEVNVNIPENYTGHLIKGKNLSNINSEQGTFNKDSTLSLSRGSLQFILKLVPTPPELKKTPFFLLEKSFQKDLAKVYGSLLLPMLLLLFVGVEPKIPKKEIAIVYKRKAPIVSPNSDMKSMQTAKKMTGNQGEQQTKPEQAKATAQKVAKADSKPAPKKAAAKAKRKIASVKTYKFNAPSNLNSLFDSKVGSTKIAQESSNIKTESVDFSKSGSVDATRSDVKIAKIGNGKDLTNFGVAGLSNKKGFQTAHIESETVVLGSMDPELLRKILQEYIPQFRHCYQQELTQNSDDIKGVIDLNFRINGNGSVSKINIASKRARFSKLGTNCVASVLKLIHFPKPKGGGVVDVRQPLNFFSDTQKIWFEDFTRFWEERSPLLLLLMLRLS